jgi:hypothetical protein
MRPWRNKVDKPQIRNIGKHMNTPSHRTEKTIPITGIKPLLSDKLHSQLQLRIREGNKLARNQKQPISIQRKFISNPGQLYDVADN